MQTFIMNAEMEFKVVVPEKFLKDMREACQAPDASPFYKVCQEQHPEDDDEFILMVLRHGLKREIRGHVLNILTASGMGGTFSPVQLKDRTPPKSKAVLATEVDQAIPA